jgi:hypothetical protein
MRAGLAILSAAILVASCGLNVAETPPPSGPLPTGLASLTPAIEGTHVALDAALHTGAGVGLDDAPEAYRPAEPPVLAYAPRAVFKVRLPNDPNRLYVLLYSFPDAAAAAAAGREAAAFYASGPALVQFPPDTRFALSQVGEVLVFSAWSPGSTSDRPAAEAAFDVVRGFGQAIPVGP